MLPMKHFFAYRGIVISLGIERFFLPISVTLTAVNIFGKEFSTGRRNFYAEIYMYSMNCFDIVD